MSYSELNKINSENSDVTLSNNANTLVHFNPAYFALQNNSDSHGPQGR